jgi:hypothetical protein
VCSRANIKEETKTQTHIKKTLLFTRKERMAPPTMWCTVAEERSLRIS